VRERVSERERENGRTRETERYVSPRRISPSIRREIRLSVRERTGERERRRDTDRDRER